MYSVVVPFLLRGGALAVNDLSKLSLGQLVLYLTINGGQTQQEYADAVLAVFTTLRAARDTASPDDPDDSITPRSACHEDDDSNLDDRDADGSPRRGGGGPFTDHRRNSNHRNNRRSTRGNNREILGGNSSSSSSSK